MMKFNGSSEIFTRFLGSIKVTLLDREVITSVSILCPVNSRGATVGINTCIKRYKLIYYKT